MRYAIMLLACLVVGGACAWLWHWFSRRLDKIEEARWGAKK
jgi:hypothetical protein